MVVLSCHLRDGSQNSDTYTLISDLSHSIYRREEVDVITDKLRNLQKNMFKSKTNLVLPFTNCAKLRNFAAGTVMMTGGG